MARKNKTPKWRRHTAAAFRLRDWNHKLDGRRFSNDRAVAIAMVMRRYNFVAYAQDYAESRRPLADQ